MLLPYRLFAWRCLPRTEGGRSEEHSMLVFCVAFVHVHSACSRCPIVLFWVRSRSCARVQHFRYPLPLARRFRSCGQALVRLLPGAFARVACDGRDKNTEYKTFIFNCHTGTECQLHLDRAGRCRQGLRDRRAERNRSRPRPRKAIGRTVLSLPSNID